MIEYAFPYERSNGMTLRDYFAAQVLPCLITQKWDDDDSDAMSFAQEAYAYADAMMFAKDLDDKWEMVEK
jgi:hypothetical protein